MLIYFLEDDLDVSYIIKKTIENANYQARGFKTASDFLDAYHVLKPDLILLDVMLPDVSGLDVLKLIRKKNVETPIIMISAKTSEMDKVSALDAGADDYITKPFGILELTSRIHARLRQSKPNKLSFKDILINDERHEVFINDTLVYFTNKEYLILKALIDNSDKVIERENLFLKVWDTHYMGETRTLDMHIKSIRQKLKENNSSVVITTIRGVGYQVS